MNVVMVYRRELVPSVCRFRLTGEQFVAMMRWIQGTSWTCYYCEKCDVFTFRE